jgi:hypothetical protein
VVGVLGLAVIGALVALVVKQGETMRRFALVFCLLLCAGCPTTNDRWDALTPEEKAAEIDFAYQRVKLYYDVFLPLVDAQVAQGNWKAEDVALAKALAAEAGELYLAWSKAEKGDTVAQQRELRLKLEATVLQFLALGIQRIVAERANDESGGDGEADAASTGGCRMHVAAAAGGRSRDAQQVRTHRSPSPILLLVRRRAARGLRTPGH